MPGQTDINPSDINQPDVDQPYDNQPDISQTEIGSLVKAQYIKMDQRYGLSAWFLVVFYEFVSAFIIMWHCKHRYYFDKTKAFFINF